MQLQPNIGPKHQIDQNNSLFTQFQSQPTNYDRSFIEVPELIPIQSKVYEIWQNLEDYVYPDSFKLDEQSIYEYADGSIYRGEMQNGVRCGCGVLFSNIGFIYEGFQNNSLPDIYGRIIYPNYDIYHGEIQMGLRNGWGIFRKINGDQFEGQWLNDKMNGMFCQQWSDGTKFVGSLLNDIKHGNGKFDWSDGSFYEGQFFLDKIQGRGTLIQSNGEIYKGDWQQNLMHGQGEYIWQDGRKYQGQVHKLINLFGKKNGFGSFLWLNNRKYVGFWSEDQMNGNGIMIESDGSMIEGQWQQGILIQSKKSEFF